MARGQMDPTFTQLKVELECASKDELEWKVLADLYEDNGNSDLACGIRTWLETIYEPVCPTFGNFPKENEDYEDYLEDFYAWSVSTSRDKWTRRHLEAWKDDFFFASPEDGQYLWRWQSHDLWLYDENFVHIDVHHRLKGRSCGPWVCYTSRVEAILDFIQVMVLLFGPGPSWPDKRE